MTRRVAPPSTNSATRLRPEGPHDHETDAFLDRSPLQSAADVESARTHFPVFERNFMSAQEQLDVFVPGRRFPAELSQSHNFHRPAWPLCRVHTNMLANISGCIIL